MDFLENVLYYHSSIANFGVSIIGFVNEVLFTHYHSILYLHKRRLVTENIASPSCLFALARGQPCRWNEQYLCYPQGSNFLLPTVFDGLSLMVSRVDANSQIIYGSYNIYFYKRHNVYPFPADNALPPRVNKIFCN